MPANTSISASICMLALLVTQLGDALRMINLDTPETALQGDTIQLSCFYNLQNTNTNANSNHKLTAASTSQKSKSSSDIFKSSSNLVDFQVDKQTEISGESEVLYAIKWYKDEREFFRYLTQDWPRKQWLPMDGIVVDVDKSDNHTVVLKNVSLKTSGSFKCEVSTDAPSFVTKSIERKMIIYYLPNEGPVIELIKPVMQVNWPKTSRYFLGDRVDLLCSAPESKPAAEMDWVINESLNLSSSVIHVDQSPLFEIKHQRFVRLPLVNGSSNGKHLSLMRSRQLISSTSYTTYELQNATLAVPSQKNSHRVPVNLASSLGQLAEMSTTRLSFTVDANLLQLVTQTKLNALPLQVSKLAELQRISQSPGNEDATREENVLSGLNSTKKNSSEIKTKRSNLSEHLPSLESKVNIVQLETSFVTNLNGKKKLLKGGISFVNDKQKLVLKVKCVARVMQLSMFDEIKIRLVNKTRDNADELAIMDAQRRQNPKDTSSGGTSHMKSRYQTGILMMISIIFMVIYQ